jgi:rhodanese-related sulfurtransferase
MGMVYTLAAIVVIVLLIFFWIKRTRDHRESDQHSITPEGLNALLASNQDVLIFDVRQPLDLLTDSEIIPGAKRVSPKEVLENPSLIPREHDLIVYCTCQSDKTSRAILHRALTLQILRVKFLKGGLAAWKAKGYPVEPYDKPFRLDSGA